MVKARIKPYVYKPYNQYYIDKFKSSDNMLKHARFDGGQVGYFILSRKTGEMMAYIAWEGDMIIAVEVAPKFQKRGLCSTLLRMAEIRGANKLTVNKNNTEAINIYKHLGYKRYKSSSAMLFMKKKEN